ncbi:MAG TPA: hypothetical protein PL048_09155 [Leptospiraceae bacterium]|nr:hypothetical protein [Leptospiraceae bacterium]HMY67319.1 hypothetical protein [Leptospiraceae bacterium]HMZ58930.1 hypothetical protein [Leptospiraceae bacterium]HNF13465.1 hypothetical protein [Leptospiraceae bacterium]HNH09787.1 hypothetical protein [Leptospiraceae bacterium]
MSACKCGTTRQSPDAEEIAKYSKTAIFLILFGISAKPISVDFKCRKCGKIIDSLSSEELKVYR